jgi:hypothetical protein
LFVLSACSRAPYEEIKVTTIPVEKPILTLPPVDELNLKDVEWHIITKDNFEEKIREFQERGIPVAFFAVSGDGYEALSLNLNDLRSQIEQLNAIIVAYENYYQASDRALDRANEQLSN